MTNVSRLAGFSLASFGSVSWILFASILLVGVAEASDGRTPRRHKAHVARITNVVDRANLEYRRTSGSLLIEDGEATGTIPGYMQARVKIASTVTADFRIYARGGRIDGHGRAIPHGSGLYQSFGGSFVVTGGSGRYAHAHGHAGLYGTFNRRTYALVVQTTGQLSY